ncbi:2-keto-4-pentenoate hydratase [Acidisphaera sp. S103]|uniref:2-keto-4-pentenoate hydratase n=1 Tax=Acidisphaera sp. S103 TaxID=1747223 RepID=UPI00131E6CF0|nr:fumarylacetoacetate hydrolase family protein [Acidisphaera sp. S103]
MNNDSLIEAFWQSRQQGVYFPPAYFGKLTVDQSYAIQLGLIERRRAAGERQIGWKVGLTAPAIQQQFGFHEPVFGCVLDSKPSGHVFAPTDLIAPGFENELCMRLRVDLSGTVNLDEARAAIDVVYPSLEIIETRGPFTEQIALALADNAQQKTVILGSPVALPADLTTIEARVTVNNQQVGTGTGDAVLGNPLNSIVWLAAKLGAYGRRLKAGEIVMTGSFTRQFPIAPGDKIETVFSGVGTVKTAMSA